jgi:hypothetical protein
MNQYRRNIACMLAQFILADSWLYLGLNNILSFEGGVTE